MRKIEFRGKRIDNGEWVYGYLFKIWERTYILWGTTNGIPNMIEVRPETVSQYTGLKDKNDKEIYEGDIVCTPYIDCIFGDMVNNIIDKDFKWTVVFNEGSFCVENEDRMVYLYSFTQNGNVEVIGNLYENPNLLEEPHED